MYRGRSFSQTISEALLRATVLSFVRLTYRPKLLTDPLPEGPCFYYGNHANNMDPFFMSCFLEFGKATAGVMTMEQFRSPITRFVFRNIDLMGTRKHQPEPKLIRFIMQHLKDGRRFCIYPEGGRRWDGRPIDDWISSTAKLFVKMGVPIYPIITHGSYIGWPRWAKYPRPAHVEVEARPALTFDRKTPLDDALRRLKAEIDFDENIVPDHIKPKWAYRPADGIDKLLYRDPETGENGGISTPDGTYVVNEAGSLRLKMQPDSTMLDEKSGRVYTSGELYDRIKALPLQADAAGAYVTNHAEVHEEANNGIDLMPRGHAVATLYDDAIRLIGSGIEETIPLEAIRYINIERNFKLQVTTEQRMLQLSLTLGGSVLQWEDYVKRLKATASAATATPSEA